MKADNILNEILENNPELKGKEKELNKIINALIESNPDIKADELFKLKLKSKLNTVIGIKSNKKINKINSAFLISFVNIFSVLFVIAGIFYFIPSTNFFNKDEGVKFEVKKIKSEDNINTELNNDLNNGDTQILNDELLEVDKIIGKELDGVNNKKINNVKNNENIKIKKMDVILDDNVTSKADIIQKDDVIQKPENIPTQFKLPDDNIINQIDQPQISPMSIGIDSTSYDNSINRAAFNPVDNNILQKNAKIGGDVNTESDIIIDLEELIKFQELCLEKGGEILLIENENICRTDINECKESEYINGTCDFLKIK